MIIRKKKFKEIMANIVLKTAKQCGKNLSLKDRSRIINSALERKE